MEHLFIKIIGFYLVLIGTWRLATATVQAPIGQSLFDYRKEEENYHPLRDFVSIKEIFIWIKETAMSFNKPGRYTSAVILHKKFNWGLLWLLIGMSIQFIDQLFPK